jgi:hypothetical protein
MRRVASAVACAQLRLNRATLLGGTDPDTEIRGMFGGRLREGFGTKGVWP